MVVDDITNRLTDVDLPNCTDVEFTYDGMGRRLTKTVTETSGTDTLETTYKHHYLSGQITTIDIDQTTTTTPFVSSHSHSSSSSQQPPVILDGGRESQPKSGAIFSAEMPDQVGHDVVGVGHDVDETQQTQTTTTTKDETIHIHLGPNSQPISFEWVRYDYANSTTLDDTYYYHYDIHGNVIKITDDSTTPPLEEGYDMKSFCIRNTSILLIIVFISISGILSCGQKTYQEVNDLKYDVSILVPDEMTEEEWMDKTLFIELGVPYTGRNYYQESTSEAINTADSMLSKGIVKYVGEKFEREIEQYDHLSRLIFKWQCRFDMQNNQILSYRNNSYIDQWVKYFSSEISNVELSFDVSNQEDLELAIRRSYMDLSSINSDFLKNEE